MSETKTEVHIYRANSQPATKFKDDVGVGKPFWIRRNPRHSMTCHECGTRRWAKYLRVQVYYDGIYVFCADSKECKRRSVSR